MSYEPTNESSRAELEAAENNDIVTNDELGEMHPDMTLAQIGAQLEYDEQVLKASNPDTYVKPRAAARQGRKTFNTGPKGVLTDYEEAKLKMRARRIQENLRKKEKVYMQLGANNDKAVKPFRIKHQPRKNKNKNKDKGDSKRDSDDDSSDSDSSIDSDDDDAEIMKLHKQQLLEQMEKYKPKYGSCMEVTAWTFDEKVEHAPKDVITVMNVYQDVCLSLSSFFFFCVFFVFFCFFLFWDVICGCGLLCALCKDICLVSIVVCFVAIFFFLSLLFVVVFYVGYVLFK